MYGKTKAGVSLPVLVDSIGRLISDGEGAFAEAVRDGNCFYGANQTGCVWTVELATTYTGLCVSNPNGSGKILSILAAGYSEIVAPTGINDAWLAGGYHGTTEVVAGAAGVSRNLKLGGATGVGKVWTGATLPVAPTYILPIQTGHTAAALSGGSPCFQTINGIIQVPPGGFVVVACFTIGVAVGAKAAILWREVAV
jgi:hypothetical protein